MQSAWIVAGQDIYDVTEYMNIHPGGSTSLLKKSGGLVDCTRDLNFHSKRGQKLWQQYHVGKVIPCPSQANQSPHNNKPGNNMVAVGGDWWKFW
jgi:cytochrome b involved in lipid metabolism